MLHTPRPAARLAAGLTIASLGLTVAATAPSQAATAVRKPAAVRAVSPNEVAFDYFVSKGLGKHHAAAMVGNFMQESGTPINPKARQAYGPGMGIAQWSRGDRWNKLVKYAKKTKRSPYALRTQLDFVWVELNGVEKRSLTKLRKSRNIPAATVAFAQHYERCAPRWCHNAKRTAYAKKVHALYGR